MWVQVTDTTDVCLFTVLSRKTVKNSNKICKWANNIINKTLLKDFLWHLIAVKYREDRGGGVWTTGYASILRFTVLPEILFAYKHINHRFFSKQNKYLQSLNHKQITVSVFDDIYNYNSYVFYHILTIMQKIKFELWTQKTRSFYQLIKIITRISFSCFTVSSVIGGIIVSTSPQSWSDDLTLSLILIIKLFLTICKNLYLFWVWRTARN